MSRGIARYSVHLCRNTFHVEQSAIVISAGAVYATWTKRGVGRMYARRQPERFLRAGGQYAALVLAAQEAIWEANALTGDGRVEDAIVLLDRTIDQLCKGIETLSQAVANMPRSLFHGKTHTDRRRRLEMLEFTVKDLDEVKDLFKEGNKPATHIDAIAQSLEERWRY